MKQLMTRWGRQLDKNHILQEYPRPSLVRDSYFNLNGEWEYAIRESGENVSYDGKILVPFSPETLLSGVGRILLPGQFLHYRRKFTLPQGFRKDRVLLHFGAVDQECKVFLNGIRLGGHRGGYLPFSYDITEQLAEGENELTLQVRDWTEQRPHARGKQKLKKSGKYASLFYTPQSGIWKTVWMESVPDTYIERLKITPLFDQGAVSVFIGGGGQQLENGRAEITVLEGETAVALSWGDVNGETAIRLKDFKAWSPDSPYLYGVKVTLGQDTVSSYFGMRKVSVERDVRGILRFFLNNEPVFFNGVLDQGYWPESLMTPPSDEALLYDIQKLKELGYNTIRKHIKIEPERFYYHCDKLGMFVWQDMPNGGGDYNMGFVTRLPNAFDWFARGVRDSHYRLFRRGDEKGRRQYYRDLKGMVDHLTHFPSVVAWVPFNEGWGQFDAKRATALIRRMDPTRLINEACGWFDQKGGDMYSIHNYNRRLKVYPQRDRVVALTEYGGYAYPVQGHLACDKEFGYRFYRSQGELTRNYKRLWREEIFPNLERGLGSAIYTQTSDIEEEINGLMTYDREVDKMEEAEVKRLNAGLYERFREVTDRNDS